MAETSESPKKLPFDEAVVAEFKDTIHKALTDHPELRSVGVIFDWNGPLNEAAIKAGLWTGEDGGVNQPAAIAGSIHQTMKLLLQQVNRMAQLEQGLKEELAIIGQAVVLKRQALELMDKERQPTEPASETPGEPSGQKKAGKD